MRIENLIVVFVESYAPLVCIIGAFFGGDGIIIFLSSLSGQGLISFWTIIFFCSLGTMSADVMWFFIGRTRLTGKIISSKQLNSGYSKIQTMLAKFGRSDFLLLFLVKFIYGIRTITIIYFSRERKNFYRFIGFDSIAILAITLFISSLGWMAGKGISSYVNIYENFRTAIKIIIIFLVIFFILKSFIKKWLLKEKRAPQ